MSFDEYAEYIYQKHRLCVALAVLKTKPPNLTSIQYLEQLKSKMADMDDDVTICSDDFVMDYDETNDSITILKDFVEINDVEMSDGPSDGGNNVNEQPTPNLPEDLSQTTFYISSQSQSIPTTNNYNIITTSNDQNIPQEYYTKDNLANSINNNENTCIDSTAIKLNKDNLKKGGTNPDQIGSNAAYLTNNIVSTKTTVKDIINYGNTDSQKTITYTVPRFTQNNTHYSASQPQMFIPDKYLQAINKNIDICTTKNVNIPHNLNNIEEINNTDINKTNTNIDKSNKAQVPIKMKENKIPSTDKTNKSTQFDKHQNDNNLSQNQNDINHFDSIVIHNNDGNKKTDMNDKDLEYSQNLDEYFNEIQSFIDKDRRMNINNDNTLSLQYDNQMNNIQTSLTAPDTNIIDPEQNTVKEVMPKQTSNILAEVEADISVQNKENTEELALEEEERESVEVIPYKVLGELSKIKTFLRRRDRRMSCDGFSSDSGYRSDSQIRSSGRGALQLSGISMNQSAYSLLNHIVQCPLVAATRDITAEIAQALAQLINKLHDEETYPPFLEELLDTVDILLRQVFKGAVSDYTEFLKKDEFLERLLLLNKSVHIQKHTIDKITQILIKLHERLTDENSTYELTSIDQIENASYIFHVLEILLKKYIKNKTASSQNTQSQDEEKIFKKSCITDIWRRKWNPNLKESSVGSRENRCVLKSCSDILNKIVVDCVDSYSLVAFSALKCFNSMQS